MKIIKEIQLCCFQKSSQFCCLIFCHLFMINFHLSFKNNSRFGKCFFKYCDKCIQMLFSVLWHYTNSKPCLSHFYHRILNTIYMNTLKINLKIPKSIIILETNRLTTSLPIKTGKMAQG